MVDFAGWSMPVQYTSVISEHTATREAAGTFDISHMGRIRIEGTHAAKFLDRIVTRRVTDMRPGQIRYALVTNEQGGILDDVLVYHLETPSGQRYYLLVVNASNRAKIMHWIGVQWTEDDLVTITDRTVDTAMIAVQGPQAVAIVDRLVDANVSALKYYHGCVTSQMNKSCIVSRTGYTGEDGCELIVRNEDAQQVWNNILLAGRDAGIQPVGLGARDTLRLEAGMPLYGHELSEEINPYQAGLGFAVNLKDRDFVGRDAVASLQHDSQQPVRVGIELAGKRPAREHCPVLLDGQTVGEISSGTFSPTFRKPLAMAYVSPAAATLDTELTIDIRGKQAPARVTALPFYTRSA